MYIVTQQVTIETSKFSILTRKPGSYVKDINISKVAYSVQPSFLFQEHILLAPGGGKMKDPGNKVASKGPRWPAPLCPLYNVYFDSFLFIWTSFVVRTRGIVCVVYLLSRLAKYKGPCKLCVLAETGHVAVHG